jgi:hypothetical protein
MTAKASVNMGFTITCGDHHTMPATSQAALTRKLAGKEPPKDPVKQAAGRKGAKVKHGLTDQQIIGKQTGMLAKGVARGGREATDALLAKLNDDQWVARQRVKAIAGRNAEKAVDTLVGLMSGVIEAPAAVRRMAALDILELAGAGKDAAAEGDKPMEEMSLAELQQYINQQVSQLQEIESVEIVQDDSLEAATDGNRQPD